MPSIQNVVTIEDLSLNRSARKLFIKGRHIPLRNKEFCLLQYFIANMGRVLSRTQILEDVWDRNICCSTNTVDVHVSSLRRKLLHSSEHSLIQTVHCVGYIFETEQSVG